jgi:hypothetical protein
MEFIFSTPVLIRHLWQLKTAVFLYRCLICIVPFRFRQNGQPVKTGMAVVIQEMVAAEAAGVLFSRDPITGNPSKIVITANFGLGEV